MSIQLPGYQVNEIIYESSHSVVYRGVWERAEATQPVVLKCLKEAYPSPEAVARFRREYNIIRRLNLPGIASAYALEKYKNGLMMVLEDFGGRSLADLMEESRFSLETFLRLAGQITSVLGEIHRQQVIHKDLNPANIVLNPATGQVKIIDFNISTLLSRENAAVRSPNVLEGTLPYMSPEQTGRMNRSVDYRTDFYSLGITFYQMLTGQLPFKSTDAVELVHAHIARYPAPPHTLNDDIPLALSEIVLKLLAKTAEERYQSAYGLQTDLERCLDAWRTHRRAERFSLGQEDVSEHFQVSQKLYGREVEAATLLAAFERVSQGASEMMLVVGYAGVGKSALINEIHKPLVRERGYFISGKFDQFQRSTPYASLIQAFQDLIRQLLTESDSQIARWREKLLAVFGPNGQIIIDVIPEVELIVGPQPRVAELGPLEAQNRFNLLFQAFVGVFTTAGQPLVIFLDDLQWADGATLKLLHLFMTDPDRQYLLVLGAYREHEVGEAHPLNLTLAAIKKAGGVVQHLPLAPLPLAEVNRLVADSLHRSLEEIQPLAELVYHKTNGNPFFVSEFLRSLYEEKLLIFVQPEGRARLEQPDAPLRSKIGWHWDLAQIQALDITDNVVALMTGKLKKLPEAGQVVLMLAACIGSPFDLKTLAMIHDKSLAETATDLWPALQAGLALSLSETGYLPEAAFQTPGERTRAATGPLSQTPNAQFKFLHDRVQQAAYALIPEPRRQALHHQIGQLLLKQIGPEEQEKRLFDIVNQLNAGSAMVVRPEDRVQLAQLNLSAGRKAIAAAAYEPALNYLKTGIELVASDKFDGWTSHYELTLALYERAAEAAFLSTRFAEMETLVETVLERARTLLEKMKVYEIKILFHMAQTRMVEAIDIAREVLALLGLPLPRRPTLPRTLLELARTRLLFLGRSLESLKNLPPMTDPYKLAATRILSSAGSSAYYAAPELVPFIIFRGVTLSVKYGHAPFSPQAYASYGLILAAGVGQVETGYALGCFALELSEQLQAREFETKLAVIFYAFLKHWRDHVRATLPPLVAAYRVGLETGDLEYAGSAALIYCYHALFAGEELEQVDRDMAGYIEAVRKFKQQKLLYDMQQTRQVILNLQGQAEEPTRLIGEGYNEEVMLPLYLQANDRNATGILYIYKTMLCYLFGQPAQALAHARLAEQELEPLLGSLYVHIHCFYYALACLAAYPDLPRDEQRRAWKQVTAQQRKLKQWAGHAPMNYRHKLELVEAERARLQGRVAQAIGHYEQAISLARQNGYLQEEAMANELAAYFYLNRGSERVGRSYLLDARYGYLRWGALAKVNAMEAQYEFLKVDARPSVARSGRETQRVTLTTTNRSAATALDLATVMKASQAISGEIVLDRLLEKLMRIVIENAGAQWGLLLLEHEGNLWIEAEGVADREEVVLHQSRPAEAMGPDGLPLAPAAIINYVKRTRESLVLGDAASHEQFQADPYVRARQPKSILCFPIVRQAQFLGLLYLENNLAANAFTPDRLKVLELLSAQIITSLENALLYRSLQQEVTERERAEAEVRRSEEHFRSLIENASDIITIVDSSGVIRYESPAIVQVLGYGLQELLGRNAFELIHPDDLPGTMAAFREVLQNRWSGGGPAEFRFRHKNGQWLNFEAKGNNLYSEGKLIGLVINSRDVTERKQAEAELQGYRERLEELVEKRTEELTEANQQLRTLNDRLQAELALAQQIQQGLLPPAQAGWAGLKLVGSSLPAQEVGGDFYAYQAFEDGRIIVAVGDISGKGMPAALMMAVSLASLRAAIDPALAPKELLAQLDQSFTVYTRTTKQNCALCYVELTPPHLSGEGVGQLRVANAGCVIPLIRRAAGPVEWIEAGGLPLGLGLAQEFGYAEVCCPLQPGDLIILTSDGIIEATRAGDELFGFERLEQVVATGPAGNAPAMLAHLQAEVTAFVAGAEPHDDMTIVVLQVTEG